VLRGGGWFYRGWFARSAQRYASRPGIRNVRIGFRLARGHVRPEAPEAVRPNVFRASGANYEIRFFTPPAIMPNEEQPGRDTSTGC
jgi:hypothetical protein